MSNTGAWAALPEVSWSDGNASFKKIGVRTDRVLDELEAALERVNGLLGQVAELLDGGGTLSDEAVRRLAEALRYDAGCGLFVAAAHVADQRLSLEALARSEAPMVEVFIQGTLHHPERPGGLRVVG